MISPERAKQGSRSGRIGQKGLLLPDHDILPMISPKGPNRAEFSQGSSRAGCCLIGCCLAAGRLLLLALFAWLLLPLQKGLPMRQPAGQPGQQQSGLLKGSRPAVGCPAEEAERAAAEGPNRAARAAAERANEAAGRADLAAEWAAAWQPAGQPDPRQYPDRTERPFCRTAVRAGRPSRPALDGQIHALAALPESIFIHAQKAIWKFRSIRIRPAKKHAPGPAETSNTRAPGIGRINLYNILDNRCRFAIIDN
jgi:hypothetical protein